MANLKQDGYTEETTGPESVRVLVATRAKPNQDGKSPLDREFFRSFLDVSPLLKYASILSQIFSCHLSL